MSYIDTVPHEHCGVIANLPIYHPQGEYTDPEDFLANPTSLVVGGGSGEHPGAVIDSVHAALRIINEVQCLVLTDDASTVEYFKEQLSYFGIALNDELVSAEINELEMALEAIADKRSKSNFSSWNSVIWHDFVVAAQQVPARRPLDPIRESGEGWIEGALGEYILVSGRDILPKDTGSQETLEKLGNFLGHNPIYGAVYQHPRGYELYGRRKAIGEPNMRR